MEEEQRQGRQVTDDPDCGLRPSLRGKGVGRALGRDASGLAVSWYSHNGVCMQRGPGGKGGSRGQPGYQSHDAQVMGEAEERRGGKFKSNGRGKTERPPSGLLSLEGAEVLEVNLLEDTTCPPVQPHLPQRWRHFMRAVHRAPHTSACRHMGAPNGRQPLDS